MQQQILRKIERNSVEFYRQLCIKKQSVFFECFSKNWAWTLETGIELVPGRMQIEADWGGARCILRLDEAWILQMTEAVIEQAFPDQLIDPLRQVVMEAAFSEALSLIEASTRKRCSVLSFSSAVQPDEGQWYGFGFSLDDGELVTEGELWVDTLGFGFLANAIRNLPGKASELMQWDDLPLTLLLEAGWVDLPLSTFETIEIGDVLLLDECWLVDSNTIVLRLANHFAVKAAIQGSCLTMIENLGVTMTDSAQSEAMNEEALDEISLRLSFDLGQRTISLAELRTLSAGYVFELGRDVRRAVTIRVNGKAIGEGELVDINGQTGVSILRMQSARRQTIEAPVAQLE
jgi:type III secretion protein Q